MVVTVHLLLFLPLFCYDRQPHCILSNNATGIHTLQQAEYLIA